MISEIWNKYKEEIKHSINDLKHKETFYKQIPNLITLLRPLGMIPANMLFFTGHSVAAVILTAILLSTDFIDGRLARKWNVQSKLGADLDAIGDKIIFLGMSLPLIVGQPLITLSVLFELAISWTNITGRITGLDTKTRYIGKVKTCFLSATLLAGYLVELFNFPIGIFNSLIATTSIAQGITLFDYINKNHEMKKAKLLQNKQDEAISKQAQEEIINELTKEKTREELLNELKEEKKFLESFKEPDKKTNIKTKKHKKN